MAIYIMAAVLAVVACLIIVGNGGDIGRGSRRHSSSADSETNRDREK
jgi:hypothetical protein